MAVVDCDYPQHSVLKQRNRDTTFVRSSAEHRRMISALSSLGRESYPVLAATPSKAIERWQSYSRSRTDAPVWDAVLFDLPGTAGTEGVLTTLMAMDYLFVPMKADRMVLESTLNFAATINDNLIASGKSAIKGLYLFWNLVDRRERNSLFSIYETGINRLGLRCLATAIPVRANFNRDLSADRPICRCTLLPPDRTFTRECGFDALMTELCQLVNLTARGKEASEL